MASTTVVHLIYIHGFQGDHTSFQRFPTDLQSHIDDVIHERSFRFKTKSSLYPTYKSAKPISYALKNFLEWLRTQPPGPIILLGHSLGGLLAADVATDDSQRNQSNPKHPVIGMVAFDTPYLGMHPHVVVSGIASLLPKKDKEKGGSTPPEGIKSERDVNDATVNIVDDRVTDEWEQFKASLPRPPPRRGVSQSPHRSPLSSPVPPSSSQSSLHSYLPATSSPSAMSKTMGLLSTHLSPMVQSKMQTFVNKHSEEPIVKWALKHSSATAPSVQGTRPQSSSSMEHKSESKSDSEARSFLGLREYTHGLVETFQFGSCMFEASELKDRYLRIVKWQWRGGWVNYWTVTPGTGSRPKLKKIRHSDADTHSTVYGQGDDENANSVITLSDTRDYVSVSKSENDQALLDGGFLDSSPAGSPRPTDDSSTSLTTSSVALDMDEPSSPPTNPPAIAIVYPDDPPPYSSSFQSSQNMDKKSLLKDELSSTSSLSLAASSTASQQPSQPSLHSPSNRSSPSSTPTTKPSSSRSSSPSPPSPHHFIVLPTGLGSILGGYRNWEQVIIEGVGHDEVAAHTGIFIRDQNFKYDELVQRVGERVVEWISKAGV